MKKSKAKYIEKLERRTKAKFRKELKRRKKQRTLRHSTRMFKNKSKSNYFKRPILKETIRLNIPSLFSLKTEVESVIEFISILKSYSKLNNEVAAIELNFSDVISIDVGAISLLLSSIKDVAINKIRVISVIPENSECFDTIFQSGFLEHMKIMNKRLRDDISKSNPKEKNLMLMKGREKTNHREIGKSIQHAIQLLSGTKKHYQPLYGVIGEMNINSVEHAYRKNTHWVFAINHEIGDDKVIFTFADNGYGIYKTLKKNFGLSAFKAIGLKNEADIINGMFLEQYSSRFKKQYNRNKGLPAIRNLQVDNKVDNLTVISNHTYINFADGTKIDLKNEFSGTFYYCELSKKTYENNNN